MFPCTDAHASIWRALAGTRRVVTFAVDPEDGPGDEDADVTASAVWQAGAWRVAIRLAAGTATAFDLHLPGRHNVRNAAAAAAAALAAGCPLEAIGRGLEAFAAVGGRSQLRAIVRDGRARTLVDDSYNANPDSVRAAIDVLAALPAPQWLILGDMGEVGDQGSAFHREAGAYAHERAIGTLWAVGVESASTIAAFPGARRFADVESLVAALAQAPGFASVLVKGSRFMRMERVVAALAGEAARDGHAL